MVILEIDFKSLNDEIRNSLSPSLSQMRKRERHFHFWGDAVAPLLGAF